MSAGLECTVLELTCLWLAITRLSHLNPPGRRFEFGERGFEPPTPRVPNELESQLTCRSGIAYQSEIKFTCTHAPRSRRLRVLALNPLALAS